MRYFKKLEGDRLYLSPINLDDSETYTQWINQLHTSLTLGQAHRQYSLEAEADFLKQISKEHHYAIILKANDELIGNCSIFSLSNIHKTGTLGIFIGEKKNRNKGYGSEALQLLLEYGFAILNLNNIDLNVLSFNQQGIKAYEKIGFKTYNVYHEAKKIMGKYHDMHYMEILAKDFKYRYLEDELLDILHQGGRS